MERKVTNSVQFGRTDLAVFWLSICLALLRTAWKSGEPVVYVASLISLCAAVGALFHKAIVGAFSGVVIIALLILMLLAWAAAVVIVVVSGHGV